MREAWRELLWNAVEDAVMFRDPPTERQVFEAELRVCWSEAERRNKEYADEPARGEEP